MKLIKEFIEYRKLLKHYQKIDFADRHKVIMEAFDVDLLTIIANKANENIIKEGLANSLSLDYIMWYKHAVAHFISIFKKFIK